MANKRVSYAREAMAHLRGADPVLARRSTRSGRSRSRCGASAFRRSAARSSFSSSPAPPPTPSILASSRSSPAGGFPARARCSTRRLKTFAGSGSRARKPLPKGPRRARRKRHAQLPSLLQDGGRGDHRRPDARHGVGRWTAEMFLMFNLGRPDVLPVDDLGVRNAARRLYRMRKMPDAKRLRALAERWRPYRSAASWYLWRSGGVVLPTAPRRQRPAARARKVKSRASVHYRGAIASSARSSGR